MKRIKDKRKTEQLRKDALKELRKTRAHLEKEHPELMKAMRQLVEKAGEAEKKPVSEKKNLVKDIQDEDTVIIDRKKNLETILKYAALKPGSDDLKKQLKDLLH